jgi:hypothetical protein
MIKQLWIEERASPAGVGVICAACCIVLEAERLMCAVPIDLNRTISMHSTLAGLLLKCLACCTKTRLHAFAYSCGAARASTRAGGVGCGRLSQLCCQGLL